MPRLLPRLLILGGALLAASQLWPAAALAHAAFVGSDPAPGARLAASPVGLTLRFTEPFNRSLTTVRVTAVDGRGRVPVNVRAVDARRVEVTPRAALGRGAYRVDWHSVSTQDGHALEGSYSFGVRAPAAGARHSVGQSPLARSGWVRVGLRAALYGFALVLVAALLLPVLTRRPRWLVPDELDGALPVREVRDRQARLTGALAWLAVLSAVGATLAEAADAAGGLAPTRVAAFLLDNTAGAARVMVVVLFLGPALFWHRQPRASATVAVLALGAVAASGHASSASPRVPSVLNDWLHLTSACVWLGGIALLAAVWAPTLRSAGQPARLAVAREVLPAFGRVALPAFALVAITGFVSLLTQLGHLDALWQTGYGRLLAVKIGLVGLIASLSATHALRLRPRLLRAGASPPKRLERRHWRLLRAEPIVGAGVVAAVALLVAFPLPPRQLGAAGAALAAEAPVCDPCPLPRPARDELAVADHAGRQLVAAWIRRRPEALTGTVRVLDYRGRPPRVPVDVLGATTARCGTGCLRFRLAPAVDSLRVAVRDAGRRYVVVLPARWRSGDNHRARRLLTDAQAGMRRLRTVRQFENVTSGPGSSAATEYSLEAPDRMRLRTSGGVQTVIIGTRQWLRAPGSGWQASRYGSGLAFRTRSWFRWTTYARTVRLLGIRGEAGRRVTELALMDEATPVWLRLTVDATSHRVLRERMATKAHFTTTRYADFSRPVGVRAPEANP